MIARAMTADQAAVFSALRGPDFAANVYFPWEDWQQMAERLKVAFTARLRYWVSAEGAHMGIVRCDAGIQHPDLGEEFIRYYGAFGQRPHPGGMHHYLGHLELAFKVLHPHLEAPDRRECILLWDVVDAMEKLVINPFPEREDVVRRTWQALVDYGRQAADQV